MGSDDAHVSVTPRPSFLPSQAWLRVGLGYHTYPQVAVGLALGTVSALAWDALGTQVALPAVATSPAAGAALVACVSCAVVAFVGFNMRHWARGGG